MTNINDATQERRDGHIPLSSLVVAGIGLPASSSDSSRARLLEEPIKSTAVRMFNF